MHVPFSMPIPRQWPSSVKSALIHAVSLASAVFTCSCVLSAKRNSRDTRQNAELALAYQENQLLQEELAIKDERIQRIAPHRRPQYSPIQHMRILSLQAARRWSLSQTADAFHLSIQTLILWKKRLDEEGRDALIQVPEPVNKFPDFVRSIVRQMKALFPGMGKVKIAQVLARAGLHLGATTVGRMLDDSPKKTTNDVDVDTVDKKPEKPRIVTAKYPWHVWHLDLTAVPISSGFWVSRFPFSIIPTWPFCWWVAVVLDHFSRKVVGFAVFIKKPTAREICELLGRAIEKAGKSPRHIISDRERMFDCPQYRRWCKQKGIRPRYGAIGKHGSIAVLERFFRSMKSEFTSKTLVPMRWKSMRRELSLYAVLYNEHRRHPYLQGRTLNKVRLACTYRLTASDHGAACRARRT